MESGARALVVFEAFHIVRCEVFEKIMVYVPTLDHDGAGIDTGEIFSEVVLMDLTRDNVGRVIRLFRNQRLKLINAGNDESLVVRTRVT